ncbi:MAG TPA: RNA 2',3'-cyclic phosphodiesterase [Ramlibacter sp.]|nr:RNA 2',3'-cyclic phosphodiesterase [Ramlibacter sp.]
MRLFLALWPDARTRAAIAACQQAWTWPPAAAPVAAQRLHLTLHFIGNVPEERLPHVVARLRVDVDPFELSLDRAEVWPNSVAVLQPRHAPREMIQLHRKLADALLELKLPVESRPFRPHVTLARRARGALPPPRDAGVPWPANDGYVLAQSLPGGAGYRVLERFS